MTAAHAAIVRGHPEAYSAKSNVQLEVSTLRDQIAAPARTILLVLLGAAAVVFVIAASNVANLILARSVRREGELAVRAALGAGPGALRRTLLAESLVLCGAGAVLGVMLARPLVALVSRYRPVSIRRSRSPSIRACSGSVPAWARRGRAPRLRAAPALRQRPLRVWAGRVQRSNHAGTNRRLRVFAMTQIACSFVLLAPAPPLLANARRIAACAHGYEIGNVLAFDITTSATGVGMGDRRSWILTGRHAADQRAPRVEGAAVGSFVRGAMPARSVRVSSSPRGYRRRRRIEIRARGCACRAAVLRRDGLPIVAGRDFTDDDRPGSEPVSIVSRPSPSGSSRTATP